jgi:hypothetical protein
MRVALLYDDGDRGRTKGQTNFDNLTMGKCTVIDGTVGICPASSVATEHKTSGGDPQLLSAFIAAVIADTSGFMK